MGSDFAQMYQSGADLWQGRYTGLYPLPVNALFAILALLPYQIALYALTGIGLALFVATLKRRALMWIFFFPVMACLRQGQLDLICLWLLRQASPAALAIMTLKPQLFPLAIPVLLADRAKWKQFVLACLVLYGPVTIIRPSWPLEWLGRMNDGRLEWYGSTSLLAWPIVGFTAILMLAAVKRLDWRAIFWTCNPTLRWYDFSLLAGASPWLIPLSWLAFGMTQVLGGHPGPIAALGIADALLMQKSPSPGTTPYNIYSRKLKSQ